MSLAAAQVPSISLAMRWGFMAALLAAGPAAAAEPAVGRADIVEIWGTRTGADGRGGALYDRDQIYFRDTLQTVRDGAMHVTFRDSSVLRLGSEASAVIDEFVPLSSRHSYILAGVAPPRSAATNVAGSVTTSRLFGPTIFHVESGTSRPSA